eukprot:13488519-Alexandrium_andersonii.AAC.1
MRHTLSRGRGLGRPCSAAAGPLRPRLVHVQVRTGGFWGSRLALRTSGDLRRVPRDVSARPF